MVSCCSPAGQDPTALWPPLHQELRQVLQEEPLGPASLTPAARGHVSALGPSVLHVDFRVTCPAHGGGGVGRGLGFGTGQLWTSLILSCWVCTLKPDPAALFLAIPPPQRIFLWEDGSRSSVLAALWAALYRPSWGLWTWGQAQSREGEGGRE